MLGFLAKIAASERNVAIDLGSEFMKVGVSTVTGTPQMFRDGNNRVSIASAMSIQTKERLSRTMSVEDARKLRVRYGEGAVRVLKNHPEYGYRYLPYKVGKWMGNNWTGPMTPSEMLGIRIWEQVSELGGVSKVDLIVPMEWTGPQKELIQDACRFVGLPVRSIQDDSKALGTLYASTRHGRYVEKPRVVLFVDIGTMSIKVTGMEFEWTGEGSKVKLWNRGFKEGLGSEGFVGIISEKRGISKKKAEKILKRGKVGEDLEEASKEIEEMVKRIKEETETLSQKRVEEIQVIGGGSNVKVIMEGIKRGGDGIGVLRDFNANEAIALGGVYGMDIEDGYSILPSVDYESGPSKTMTVESGDSKGVVCERWMGCVEEVVIERGVGSGSNSIRVLVDESDVMKGVNRVVQMYRMNNLTGKETKGIIRFGGNPMRIIVMEWCEGEDDCHLIDYSIELVKREGDDIITAPVTMKSLVGVEEEKVRKNNMVEKMMRQIDTLQKVAAAPEAAEAQGLNRLSEGSVERVKVLSEEMEGEGFGEKTLEEVKKMKDEIREMIREILPKRQGTEGEEGNEREEGSNKGNEDKGKEEGGEFRFEGGEPEFSNQEEEVGEHGEQDL